MVGAPLPGRSRMSEGLLTGLLKMEPGGRGGEGQVESLKKTEISTVTPVL